MTDGRETILEIITVISEIGEGRLKTGEGTPDIPHTVHRVAESPSVVGHTEDLSIQ